MATRMLRDGILSSERVARLGWAEEVFYRRLMSVVDDYGRFYAHPALLRAACYPLLLDKVSDSDVGKWLTACVDAALVRVYPALDGKRYLEIQDFGQRIQSKSKFPDPVCSGSTVDHRESPEHTVGHGESRESTAVVGVGDGVVVEGDMAPPDEPAPPAEPPFIAIPCNRGEYPVTEAQVQEFSDLYPAVDVRQELRAMRAWAIANPAKRKTPKGALRFVNAWLAKEQDSGGSRRRSEPESRRRRAL